MWRYKMIGIMLTLNSFWVNITLKPSQYGFEKADRMYSIRKAFHFNPTLLESSGLGVWGSSFFTHTDSGGQPALYLFSEEGKIRDTIQVSNALNLDWEDATTDNSGHIFISDLGNNRNNRKDLKIFRFSPETGSTDTLWVSYADQKSFPPVPEEMNYDSEGIFWYDAHIYIFSKNRGDDFLKVYKIHDEPGSYTPEPWATVEIPMMVTGADIDQETGTFWLLGYGMLISFDWSEESFFSKPKDWIKWSRGGQKEGVVVVSDKELLISNEMGKVFRMKRKKNK